MRRLPRRLALWGGAAAVASGGFAFMASNAVAGSSLGDGQGTASGYTISTVHWVANQVTYISNNIVFVTSVTFKITSDANTAPANIRPTNVNVYLVMKTGKHLPIATGKSGYISNNFFGTNVATHWHILPTGKGTGTVAVHLNIRSGGYAPAATVTGIDVEANT
ncbi:MAG: hypothetical protein M0007_14115 [Actinomycetota bacterium]|nr:hypothetical protein [Actinomycetota bacterium]